MCGKYFAITAINLTLPVLCQVILPFCIMDDPNESDQIIIIYGLSRSLPDPASDCTDTCILVFSFFLNAYLVYA